MAAEDRRCCRDPFTVAPRLRRRSRTSVSRLELVERRDQARSRGKAVLGSPFGPRGRPLHALQSFLGTLVHPCSANLVRLNRSAKQCLFVPERRFSDTGAPGMSFSRFQAWLKPCLGSLEQGTGQQCLWTLWRARIQRPNRTLLFANRTPVGHASDMRSGTLVLEHNCDPTRRCSSTAMHTSSVVRILCLAWT